MLMMMVVLAAVRMILTARPSYDINAAVSLDSTTGTGRPDSID